MWTMRAILMHATANRAREHLQAVQACTHSEKSTTADTSALLGAEKSARAAESSAQEHAPT
jgi:hypothetical protein